ncbi:MAG: (Fe-S)-binding protein [Anaerolineae bacterium]
MTSCDLFVTCLIDLFYPDTGEAVVAVLEKQGCTVDFRPAQECCGRFALEAGYTDDAAQQARQFCAVFADAGLIVVPSPACTAMIQLEYPHLLPDDPRAAALAARTWELSQFLVDYLHVSDPVVSYAGKIAYQPACHLLHDLHGAAQAPALLSAVQGATLAPWREADECCGFGGPFALNLPEVSASILDSHVQHLEASGADVVVTCDPGCLLHLNGGLDRQGCRVRAVHLADLLAGRVTPAPAPAAAKVVKPKLRPRPW